LIARVGPVAAVDSLLAQIMNVPPHALIELTVLYGALLAGSAALVAQSIRPPGSRDQGTGNRGA